MSKENQDKETLNSWKEIAAFLDKSEKTCRRLERELGLPVHRLEDTPKARVYAHKNEIDIWLKEIQASERLSFTAKFSRYKLTRLSLAVVVLALVAGLVWRFFLKKYNRPQASRPQSIAVLPFVDLSPKKDHEYLAEGIPETLINALSRMEGLNVPGRTSSFYFKGEPDLHKIGEHLRVDTLLEGSIQVSGRDLRIIVRLINVDDGYQIWSNDYQGSIDNIFTIQDDITRSVSDALKVKLRLRRDEKVAKIYTENNEAFDFYLKGLFYLRRIRATDPYRAIEFFQKAIEKDVAFAHAYVGLAQSFILLSDFSLGPSSDFMAKAETAAIKALQLNESLAEAHSSYGEILYFMRWDWGKAEQEFKRSLQLDPNSCGARLSYCWYLIFLGKYEEAYTQIKKALESDPLSIRIAIVYGLVTMRLGQYNEALKYFLDLLQEYPKSPTLLWRLALIYMEMGEYEKGIQILNEQIKLMEGENISDEIGMLAFASAKWGKRKEALEYLHQLISYSEENYVSPTIFAIVNGVLGNLNEAFEWLDQAYSQYDSRLVYARHFWYDPIRNDPRFKEMMKKIGLKK